MLFTKLFVNDLGGHSLRDYTSIEDMLADIHAMLRQGWWMCGKAHAIGMAIE
jgi:hypothetical protein